MLNKTFHGFMVFLLLAVAGVTIAGASPLVPMDDVVAESGDSIASAAGFALDTVAPSANVVMESAPAAMVATADAAPLAVRAGPPSADDVVSTVGGAIQGAHDAAPPGPLKMILGFLAMLFPTFAYAWGRRDERKSATGAGK